MSANNLITIGTALKWRGPYSSNKIYYKDNITEICGCIFRCRVENSQNQPPVNITDEANHFEFINAEIWDVILDMSMYYNKIADIAHYADETLTAANELNNVLDEMSTFAKKPIQLNSEDDLEKLVSSDSVIEDQLYFTAESE